MALAVATAAGLAAGGDGQEPAAPDGEEWFGTGDLKDFLAWMPGVPEDQIGRIFSAGDGVLRVSGDGFGYLRTRESFEDFRLSAEFRWGEGGHPSREGKARDSGIFIHATGPDGNSHDGDGAYMAGIECNLFEGACGDVLLIRGDDAEGRLIAPRVEFEASREPDRDGFHWWAPGGSVRSLEVWGRINRLGKARDWADVRGFREQGSIERPAGAWNAIEIVSLEGTVEIRLNGVLVNSVRDSRPSRGHVLFQCEGSEIHFRRVRVSRLRPAPDQPR